MALQSTKEIMSGHKLTHMIRQGDWSCVPKQGQARTDAQQWEHREDKREPCNRNWGQIDCTMNLAKRILSRRQENQIQ